MTALDASARRRMSKKERRSQLLDAAADAVVGVGRRELTMDRLADRAGVSKALVYNHFDSIDHVMLALYQREGIRLGWRIWNALEDAHPSQDLVVIHIRAYFEGITASGDIFGALTTPGHTVAHQADPDGEGPRFSSRVLERFHGMERERARIVAPLVNAAILGAGNAWRRGLASRQELEDAAIHLLRAAIDWKGTAA